MKEVLILFWVGIISISFAARRHYEIYDTDSSEKYFEEFIKIHNKQYADEVEKQKRFEIFVKNLEIINQQNMNSDSAVYAINMFSDLTKEEVINMYTGYHGSGSTSCKVGSKFQYSAPDAFDWRDKNKVSRVKDQLLCGSCWAFSATGNLESQYAIKYNETIELSEQQLVDCDTRSSGCDGNDNAEFPVWYWMESSGAETEADYPYEHATKECRFDASKVKVKVSGCIQFNPQSEDEIKDILVNVGPLSIGLDSDSIHYYQGGIHRNCTFANINHAVLLVGYGSDSGIPFWVIKNSWGSSYGEQGYFRIERGVNACGFLYDKILSAVVA